MLKDKLIAIQNKAKERTVKTQNIEYDLETIVKKITKGIIKLNPEYQRKHRWTEEYSSRLIESLILNIPVPLIYISQDVDVDEEVEEEIARYSVIDGQQRLTAIYNFLTNESTLTGLEVLDDLNGLKYNELPPFLIRRLEERTIRCLRIDSTLDNQVKYDIFERLNSGSVKLEPQELRNATCRGAFKELIKELVKNKSFINATSLSPKKIEKMEDEELVLRYFALSYKDGYKSYKGSFKNFLTTKMTEFNKLDSKELGLMKENFINSFAILEKSNIDLPFAKFKSENNNISKMSHFNVAVYDSLIVPLSKMKKNHILNINDFRELSHDTEYFRAIEGSTNDVLKVNLRIDKAIEALL
ncbi:TPA: DUF262 domain-containing protein [Acinetobacter baumannii]|nr:DUF262 domain-containing protein [Acinetobacter baumannii]